MRVIAGRYKGLTLSAPKGRNTRPTPGRVREALFSILGQRVAGARVLDLFAGTGALGIEALSRGAESCVFVERASVALTALRQNVARCKGATTTVLTMPVVAAIRRLGAEATASGSPPFDGVFLDPPYAKGLVGPTLAAIHRAGVLAPGGWVVAEHAGADAAAIDQVPPDFIVEETRRFGDVALTFMRLPPVAEQGGAATVTTAIYPGSFDPVTNGHLNLIRRGLRTFDRLIVAVAQNRNKAPLFSVDERIAMIRQAVDNDERVEVDAFEGLLVDYAKKRGAKVVLRGLRAVSDFEYEFQMVHMNRRLHPDLETVFMMTGEEDFFVSSQLVREIASFGGAVAGLVPAHVEAQLEERFQ